MVNMNYPCMEGGCDEKKKKKTHFMLHRKREEHKGE